MIRCHDYNDSSENKPERDTSIQIECVFGCSSFMEPVKDSNLVVIVNDHHMNDWFDGPVVQYKCSNGHSIYIPTESESSDRT